MGHCFRRKGATGTAGEQVYVTKVADACARLLRSPGWQVRTILADEFVSRYKGDAFVAIHCDGSTSKSARGASAGYITPEGQAFARAWKRAYEERGWQGFRPDNYTDGLRNYYGTRVAVNTGNRRAIIIECGFLTNDTDREVLNAVGGPDRVALAIGDALGIVPPPAPAPAPVPQEVDTDMAGYTYVAMAKSGSRPNVPYVITGTGSDLTARQVKAHERAGLGAAKIPIVVLSAADMDGILREAKEPAEKE